MKKIFIFVVSITLTFFLGFFIGWLSKMPKDNIVVKEVKVKDTVYIKVPVTMQEYKECYESKINIQARAEGDILHIRAYDSCKSADATIHITAKRNIQEYLGMFTGGVVIGILLILLV